MTVLPLSIQLHDLTSFRIYGIETYYHMSLCRKYETIIYTTFTGKPAHSAAMPVLFFIARQHTDARTARYWYSNSVRPSVRPPVRPSVCASVRDVPVLDENGLTYCHNFFTVRQPSHSSFTSIKYLHKIPTGSPPVGALNRGEV